MLAQTSTSSAREPRHNEMEEASVTQKDSTCDKDRSKEAQLRLERKRATDWVARWRLRRRDKQHIAELEAQVELIKSGNTQDKMSRVMEENLRLREELGRLRSFHASIKDLIINANDEEPQVVEKTSRTCQHLIIEPTLRQPLQSRYESTRPPTPEQPPPARSQYSTELINNGIHDALVLEGGSNDASSEISRSLEDIAPSSNGIMDGSDNENNRHVAHPLYKIIDLESATTSVLDSKLSSTHISSPAWPLTLDTTYIISVLDWYTDLAAARLP